MIPLFTLMLTVMPYYNLQNIVFFNLLTLETINLSNNTIQRIHKFAFIYLPKLKVINLAKNNLNENTW